MNKVVSIALATAFSFTLSSFAFSQTSNDVSPQDLVSSNENASVDRNLTGFEALNEAQSLWEFGFGGAVGEVANYPASSERNLIAIAAPYFVYRGDIFRVGGGNGVRAVVVEEKNYEFDLSFGGAFSADSEDNTAREGMPELDFLFEVGPQAVFKLKDFQFEGGGNGRLNARLQARAAFSTDFSRIDKRGFVFNPVLTYQQRGRFFEGTALSASIGAVFATEKLHDYFYQVDDAFANELRDSFDAKGGYLGTELGVSFSFPLAENIRAFVGGGAQIHTGSANEDSPLYEDDITYSVAVGFVWRLYQSDAKASW